MNTYIATIWQDSQDYIIETQNKLVQGETIIFKDDEGTTISTPMRVLEVDKVKNRVLLKKLHPDTKVCYFKGIHDPFGGPIIEPL